MSLWKKLRGALGASGDSSRGEGRSGRGSRGPRGRRIAMEPLEDRRLLAVITVDSLGDGPVNLSDGNTTLRDALALAADAANPNADEIVFASSLGLGTTPGEIELLAGQLVIDSDVAITGPGASQLTIDGDADDDGVGESRVMYVVRNTMVNISGLTVSRGYLDGFREHGAGIFSDGGDLIVTDCVISHCLTVGEQTKGGGIFSQRYGTLLVTNCQFTGNHAEWFGGAIASYQVPTTIRHSTISENTSAFRGGGISVELRSLSVVDSSITANSAGGLGGGIYVGGFVTITNCEITGNVATGGGGMFLGEHVAMIVNSTIAGNSAEHGGGVEIFHDVFQGLPSFYNSIFAQNEGGDFVGRYGVPYAADDDFVGLNNLISTATAPIDPLFVDVQTYADIVGLDGAIGTADDGPRGDYRLLSGSPAIDAGNSVFLYENDSDGAGPDEELDLDGSGTIGDYSIDRDLDDRQRIGGMVVDVGAYESVNTVPGYAVRETDEGTSVSESGTTDAFTVVLLAAPQSDVVISIRSSDSGEAVVDQASLTFTPTNWDRPQIVTVSGVDDALLDGLQTTTITLSIDDANSDGAFDSLADQTLQAFTYDDDGTPGFRVVETDGGTDLSEAGTTDTFTVMLDAAPRSDVLITATSGDSGEVTVDRSSLTFTPMNWDVPQAVTVIGIDDAIVDGDQTTVITLSVIDANSDDAFDSLADQVIVATTTDDDQYDFGDAPSPYFTTLAYDGARHVSRGPVLGHARDGETDGVPAVFADGDDIAGANDDEDGVRFSSIQVGQLDASVTIEVENAPGGAKLDAWIDFDRDGAWGGAFEQIAKSVDVDAGESRLAFDVPGWAVGGETYARFRLSTSGGLVPSGIASDGEVEDYRVTILPPDPTSGQFVTRTSMAEACKYPPVVLSADVDGDGDRDILTAAATHNKITWYENNGEERFTARTVTDAVDGPRSLFAADVDGDGDTDVLSASTNDDKVAWYQNDGEGGFTAHTITVSADGALSVFAADVDGDGDMDVLSASAGDDKIAWYENDGSEDFTAHTISVAAGGAYSVFAADMDGDGDMDVLSASFADDKIAWYENDGYENFTSHTLSTTADGAHCVLAVDVDGDSDMDVLSASYRDDKVVWYENVGNPSFVPHLISDSADGVRSVVAVDVDDDGDVDVVSASRANHSVVWFENNGSEEFSPHTITGEVRGPDSVFADDVDRDGDLDVLLASWDSCVVAWCENDGNEVFTLRDVSVYGFGASSITAADLDGDGDMDAIAAWDYDRRIEWYENDGDENYTPHTVGELRDAAMCVVVVDMDGDGDLDVLGGVYSIYEIPWFENDGEGHFVAHAIPTEVLGAPSVSAADVDGDGDMDVLATAYFNDQVIWYENDGQQIFHPHSLSSTADGASSVCAADLDGDGDMDVVSAAALKGEVAWYENRGGGNFTSHIISSYADGASCVFVTDLDGDGNMDVVATSSEDNRLTWYRNSGHAHFTANVITASVNHPLSVFAGDADGDGDVDLFSASYDDNTIAWYENNGLESFTPHTISNRAYRAMSVFAADMDSDGDLDVLSASRDDGKVAWYENSAPGVTIVESNGETRVSETGTSDSFTVVLDHEPSTDVVIAITGGDTEEAVVNEDALTFTPDNWDQPQSVTVTGINDSVVDGTQTISIGVSVDVANSDDAYDRLPDRIVWVTVSDLETPGFTVAETDGGTTVSEIGTSDTFDVVLVSCPQSDVVINVVSGDTGEVTVGSPSLTFTPGNWDMPQPVVLTGVDNTIPDGDRVISIVLSIDAASSDDVYDSVMAKTVTVTTLDDDRIEYDYGDAPLSYGTTLARDGARHVPVGPTLGSHRDAEADGEASALANGDDSAGMANDEDGVSFGLVQVGHLDATVVVDVQNAPYGAVLDAWIDFNGDGSWGGPFEQIADQVVVNEGDNTIAFDVPSWAMAGATVARFRVSTEGDLSPTGLAADGEVEDKQVVILPPEQGSGVFGTVHAVATSIDAIATAAADMDGDGDMDVLGTSFTQGRVEWYENRGGGEFWSHTITSGQYNDSCVVFPTDVDGDGDMDVLAAIMNADKIVWWENDGNANFIIRTIADGVDNPVAVFAADIDGDGDVDVVSASSFDDKIAWYENDGGEGFLAHVITTSLDSPESVFVADVDSDGDMDVLSASMRDDRIAWHENDGSENFTSHVITSSADGASEVYCADINGDGDMDVLSASSKDGKITWYQNNGSESFTARTIAQVPVPQGLAVADVDGDGRLDVVTGSYSYGSIDWFQNGVNSSFTAHTVPSSADQVRSVCVADMDGDGDLDVVSGARDADGVLWLEQTNSPGFAVNETEGETSVSESGTTDTFSVMLKVAPQSDVVIRITSGDPGEVIVDKGALTFTSTNWDVAQTVTVTGVNDPFVDGDQITAITLSVDDSLSDDAFDGVFNRTVYVVTTESAASADYGDAPLPYPTTRGRNGAHHVAVGPSLGIVRDSEYDGTPSISANGDDWTGGFNDEDGVAFSSIQVGQLDATVIVNVQNAPNGAKLDAWIDFNADGSWGGPFEQIASALNMVNGINTIRFDVPSWAAQGATYARFRVSSVGGLAPSGGTADGEVEDYLIEIEAPEAALGVFAAHEPLMVPPHNDDFRGATDVFAADMDGDGDMDVVGVSHEDGKVAWYENDGSANFTEHTIAFHRESTSVVATDMDGDGDMDVLVGSSRYVMPGDHDLVWYENDGSQNFAPRTVAPSIDGAYSVFATDVDGDGDTDVLAGFVYDDKVNWYENDGSGGFAVHAISESAASPVSVFAADLDGDGDMDVLSSPLYGSGIEWYENDGNQSFISHTIASDATQPVSVFATDLDSDGDVDVLAAWAYGDKILWHENDGAGSFEAHSIAVAPAPVSVMSVFAADVDGDGDVDVLSADSDGDRVDWYENDGDENFTLRNISSTADGARSVFAADVDGDGDLDVLSASTDDGKIVWYENRNIPGFIMAESGGSTEVSEAGATDSFSVVLDTAPTTEVVILVASADTSEATVDKTELVFDAGNWDVPQVVTVAGVDDPFVNGDRTTIVTLSVDDVNSDDVFDAFEDQAVVVTTTDDEAAGFTIAEEGSGTVVSEGALKDTFTVVLDGMPQTDVVILVSCGDASEVAVDRSELVFSSSNWNVPQTVTVSGVDEVFADGDQVTAITLSVVDADSDVFFDSLEDRTVLVTTIDDERAGFSIVEETGVATVSEGGTTDAFSVVLDAAPVSDVVILVSSSDTGEVTVDKSQLTFTSANWDSPQTVTVLGMDDVVVDGDQLTTITLSIDDRNSDDAFDSVNDQVIVVTTTDDDKAGFTFVESDEVTSVSESGTSDVFHVVLDAEPLSSVVIVIMGVDTEEVAVDTIFLTFTPEDWGIAQPVTVSGVGDGIVDGDQVTTIRLSIVDVVSDDAFDLLADKTVSVTTTDDDRAGFSVTETDGGTRVSESGTTDSFSVVLDAAPLTEVVISVSSDDLGEATVDKTELTFNGDNWDVPQVVTVSGADDLFVDGDQTTGIRLSVVDADSDDFFDAVDDQVVQVTTEDDEAAGFTIAEEASGTVVSEGSLTDTFTVVLDGMPVTDVVVRISSGDAGEAGIDEPTLTFTSSNWDTPQVVTVSGVDDVLVDGDQVTAVTVSIDDAGSNDLFDSLADQTVLVTTSDDDTAGFTIVEESGVTVVSEEGAEDTFSVVLDAAPVSEVVILVSSGDTGEVTVNKGELTFDGGNWDVPQIVTVAAVDDHVVDGTGMTTIAVSIDTSRSDDWFDLLADQTVEVESVDNDTARIAVNLTTELVTNEAGDVTAEFTVVLESEPLADVTVTVSSDDGTEGTVEPTTLTFRAGDWSSPQAVTIRGVNDDVVDGDVPYSVLMNVASGDLLYDGMSLPGVTVTNSDDDSAGATIEPTTAVGSSMFPGQMFDVGEYADDMTMADFNEDGYPDIACVNRSAGEFVVLLGRGDGTFDDRVAHAIGSSATHLASGDVDGDGHIDVVTGARLFRGLGDGGFAAPEVISIPSGATGIAIEDVDGDGALDVAAVNWLDRLYLLPGRGDGTFDSRLDFEVGDGTTAVSVVDLNGDGHLDLVTANGKEDDISVLLGQGNRVFSVQQRYAVGAYPRALETADLNADGVADLIASNYHDPGVSVLLGVGDGTFEPETRYTLGKYPNATITYDIDRDGVVDVLVADSSSHNVLVLHGKGDGTFACGEALPTGGDPYEFALADFNDDGHDDLGVLCWGSWTFAVHLGQIDGTFQFGVYESVDDPAESVVLADFDNDGHVDLATSNTHYEPDHHSTVSFRFGLGDGRFAAASSYDVMKYSRSPVVGDFNEDGFADLVVTSGGWHEWSILLNQGDGTFEVTSYDSQEQNSSLTVADFNGDGHLDLLGMNVNTAGLEVDFSIHLGAGDGTFQFAHNVPLAARQYVNEPTPAVVACDLNGDGIIDLAMGPSAGEILVFLGEGDGTFGVPYRYDEVITAASLSLGDFNEDGYTDVIGTRSAGSVGHYTFEIVLLLNEGDGTFVTQVLGNYDHGVGDCVVADVNGDGHADLAAVGQAVEVLFGRGDGTFEAPVQYAKGCNSGILAAGDMDEDGWVDLVVAGNSPNGLSVLLQDPPGIQKTGEVEGAVQYSVTLDSQPTDEVTVTVASDDETEGVVWPAFLTFTAENWSEPQRFTVTGVDDDVDDGDVRYEVHATAASSDSVYSGIKITGAMLRSLNEDTARVRVNPVDDSVTNELAGSAEFAVVLDSRPTADVTVTVASDDETEGTISPKCPRLHCGRMGPAEEFHGYQCRR